MMEILHIFYEQHIATKEMGLLHVVSEAPVSGKVVKEMVNAAAVLYHQYGAGRLGADGHQEGCSICVQPLPKIRKKMQDRGFVMGDRCWRLFGEPDGAFYVFQQKP